MGNIYRGQEAISAVYRGQEAVNSVYRGQELIWQAGGGGGYVTDGLTAFYEVSSGTTSTWVDITGNGHDLYATGSVVQSGDYYRVGGAQGLNAWFARYWPNSTAAIYDQVSDWSMDGYIYFEDNLTQNFNKWVSFRGDEYSVGIECFNALRFVLVGTANPVILCSNTTLSTGTWYHFAQVFDEVNNHLYIYVNGTADADTAWTGTAGNTPADWRLRVGVVDNGNGYNVRVGNLRVYKGKALSSAEVAQNFNYDKALYGL